MAKPIFADSHAHLFYEDFKEELADVIKRAEDAGIAYIVVPGTTLETSKWAIELAAKYPVVYACVGFHPHEASKVSDNDLQEIESLSGQQKVVAVGEIGLDYHYNFSPREQQIRIFNDQISIAVDRNLPIVVHARKSMSDAAAIVKDHASKNPSWKSQKGFGARGVFHCFTGSVEEAKRLFDLGFFISYPGIVTFKNSPVVETLKDLRSTRYLIETDSPYMAPVPFRGKRNEPANVVYIAQKIAEITGSTIDEVAQLTTKNALELFGIDNHE